MLSYLPFDKTAKKLCLLASAFIYAFCTTKLEDIDIKAWGEYK